MAKDKNRHSENVTLIDFPRQKWFGKSAFMLRLYVHCLSFWPDLLRAVLPNTPKFSFHHVL